MSEEEYSGASDDFEFEDQVSDFSFDNESQDGYASDTSEKQIDHPSNALKSKTLRNKDVEYSVSTLEDFVFDEFILLANRIQSQLLVMDFDEVLMMLHHCKWQQEELMDRFYDNREKLLADCGINKSNDTVCGFNHVSSFSCSICCEDYSAVETFSLSCGHEFCINCYGSYVRTEVTLGNLIRCMIPSCNLSIPHMVVQAIYDKSDKKLPDFGAVEVQKPSKSRDKTHGEYSHNVLLKAATISHISGRKVNYKWCPAPDCDGLVHLLKARKTGQSRLEDVNEFEELVDSESADLQSIPIVLCPRDHEFCYACQYENHLPCTCLLVKRWIKKCNDDSETVNWIDANTRACPSCTASIEKNGGCNHMTCSTCKHQFCWICLGEWSLHGTNYFRCNSFSSDMKEQIGEQKKVKRESLQRYLHYYKRFALHESSMKGDIKTLDKVHQKMSIFMEEQSKTNPNILSWIDVQFLQDAFRALTSGRKTLKWAYCFGFYLQKGNYADVFEQIQEYLSRSVEDLSKIFEQIIHKDNRGKSTAIIMNQKLDIMNLSSLITKRRKTLMECASSGLADGLLKLEML